MGYVDILVCFILIIGIYLGYQRGIFKELGDFLSLLMAMLLSYPASLGLSKLLYKVLPFFNFSCKVKGIKAVNIILWRVIIYLIVLFFLLAVIDRILIKTGIKEKITDSSVEAGIISKLLGSLLSIPLVILFLYNIALLANVPNMKINEFATSKSKKIILEKTLIISKLNEGIYYSEEYANRLIYSKYNTNKTFKLVNKKIIDNTITNKLISRSSAKKINKKLYGTKVTVMDEIISDTELTNPTNTTTTKKNNNVKEK